MMANLWAMEIMNQGTMEAAKAVYKKVPRLLKAKVKELVIAAGMEYSVEEDGDADHCADVVAYC